MFLKLFKKKKENNNRILPQHIGIIMDGNGRWAKKRGLPRSAGHRVGAKNFKSITRYCNKIGIKYLTVYAFSTENWKRPSEEINALMSLFKEYLEESIRDFSEDNIKVNFIGDLTVFNDDLKRLIKQTEKICKNRTGMVLNIAMNYGGRDEILRAVKSIAHAVKIGKASLSNINESYFSQMLYTSGQPDPDLIIRPSGEYRISNFLLWQSAYSEYIIMDLLWPDFKPKDLEKCLDIFNSRNRRFGGV